MSLKQSSQFRPQIPDDLVDMLKPSGITVILQLIRDAYFELMETGIVTSLMDENEVKLSPESVLGVRYRKNL